MAVKQHNRELKKSLDRIADPLQKLDSLKDKYNKLWTDMKKADAELQKAKKRGDTLQKEKETVKSELNKANSAKDKLEKLSRDTNSENKRLRVRFRFPPAICRQSSIDNQLFRSPTLRESKQRRCG